MKGLLVKLVQRFMRGRWGTILPTIFRAAAEGQFGEPVKKAYWFLAGYRTFTGALFLGAGTALEAICSSFPDMAWTCVWAKYVWTAGALLTTVGLIDGGVRSPWPNGTPKEDHK